MTQPISLSERRCQALSVAIYVDSEVIRHGLTAMLNSTPVRHDIVPWNALVGLPAQSSGKRPDVVILACDDERTAAIEHLAQQVWAMGSKVLLLLSRSSEEFFDTVAKVSTDGFLILDQLTAEALNEALQKVCEGDVVVPPPIAGRLLARARAGQVEPSSSLPALTPRESQTLQLLVGGLSNKQIATQLRISSHGAKRLVANVLAKLNCPNRTLAVAVALQYKLVEQGVAAGG